MPQIQINSVIRRAAATAAAAAETAKKEKTSTPKKHVKWFLQTSKWYWYTVAGFIALISLAYGTRLVRQRLQRRRGIARKAILAEKPGTNSAPESSVLGRRVGAASAMFNNLAHLRSFSMGLYECATGTEITFTALYFILMTFFCFYRTYQYGWWDFANAAGMAASIQTPLIVGLASKNNVLSAITGVSYQNLNYLHRASGRACVLFSWIHTFGWIQKGLGKHGPGSDIFWTGMVCFIALNFVFLSSFAIVRRAMYEFFLVMHIVFVLLFLLALFYHRPTYNKWMWPSFLLWALDRFVSAGRYVIINKLWLYPFSSRRQECASCKIELLGKDVVRLTVARPLLRWNAGQHAMITMPSVATLRYEQHPFSFANVPTDGEREAVFIVRAHSGFTRRLINHLESDTTTTVPCYLEGPYGTPHSYSHHDSVVLVAGGTGITHILSIFLDLIALHRKGACASRHLRLVWNIRHLADLQWITPLLSQAFSEPLPSGLEVHIDVHLTRSKMADEPDGTGGITDLFANTHHAIHAQDGEKSPRSGENSGSSSEGSSTNVSQEQLSLREKSGDGSGDIPGKALKETKSPLAGLLGDVSIDVLRYTTFHSGRAELISVLEADIARTHLSMGMSVCGPSALALDTRKAVRAVNTGKRIMAGQARMELSVESFGW